MSKLLPMILVCLCWGAAQSADPPREKEPDIGIDYRALFDKHMRLVAEGKADQAFEGLLKHMQNPEQISEESKERMKKKLALIYGAGGKCLGYEVVGYKRVTSRVVRFYSVSHFEKLTITHAYLFFKGGDGQWKLTNYSTLEGLDEVEKITPIVPLGSPP